MAAKKTDSVIRIAQKLVHHLPEEMDAELRSLLQRAEEGQDTTIDVIELLSPHKNIRLWMREQILLSGGTKGETRGFGPLPGKPGPIPASKKWVCPKSECGESLPIIQEGEDAPICSVHAIKMIRAEQKAG